MAHIKLSSAAGTQAIDINVNTGTYTAQTWTQLALVAANNDLVLSPTGTGAFYLGPPADGTATGGNQRGTNAVDLQQNRSAATQVASGQDSFTAGYRNTASSTGNVALGGINVASGINTTAIGLQATASGNRSFAICYNGTSSAEGAVIFGGTGGTSSGYYSSVLGGLTNTASGQYAGTLAGRSVSATADYSLVAGGFQNIAAAVYSATIGGYYAYGNANYAVAIGGVCAAADHRGAVAFSGNSETPALAQRGKSQGQLVHLDQRTTDATPTTMDSVGTELAVPTNGMFAITGKVGVWNESDTSATDWTLDILVYESGAALTFVAGSGAQTINNTDDAGTPVLSIGSTGTNINFNITGLAGKNMRWTGVLMIARATT